MAREDGSKYYKARIISKLHIYECFDAPYRRDHFRVALDYITLMRRS